MIREHFGKSTPSSCQGRVNEKQCSTWRKKIRTAKLQQPPQGCTEETYYKYFGDLTEICTEFLQTEYNNDDDLTTSILNLLNKITEEQVFAKLQNITDPQIQKKMKAQFKRQVGLAMISLARDPYAIYTLFYKSSELLLAKKYGLEKADWTPSQGIDSLIATLDKCGPLCVSGPLGQPFYKTTAQASGKYKQGCPVYFFSKNNRITPTGIVGHSITIVGAEQRNGLEFVYFLDPNDGSDPAHPTQRRLYRMPYQELIANITSCYGVRISEKVTDETAHAYYNPKSPLATSKGLLIPDKPFAPLNPVDSTQNRDNVAEIKQPSIIPSPTDKHPYPNVEDTKEHPLKTPESKKKQPDLLASFLSFLVTEILKPKGDQTKKPDAVSTENPIQFASLNSVDSTQNRDNVAEIKQPSIIPIQKAKPIVSRGSLTLTWRHQLNDLQNPRDLFGRLITSATQDTSIKDKLFPLGEILTRQHSPSAPKSEDSTQSPQTPEPEEISFPDEAMKAQTKEEIMTVIHQAQSVLKNKDLSPLFSHLSPQLAQRLFSKDPSEGFDIIQQIPKRARVKLIISLVDKAIEEKQFEIGLYLLTFLLPLNPIKNELFYKLAPHLISVSEIKVGIKVAKDLCFDKKLMAKKLEEKLTALTQKPKKKKRRKKAKVAVIKPEAAKLPSVRKNLPPPGQNPLPCHLY